ncbi:putative transcription factor AS2-LOB family [Helianthus annuus]|nr:putative transcription factor AS2-LOB family [Helianthus annuus]
MSSTNSPCAACKFLRRKCTQECVFAPYFPPDQPQKFANVHKVFGASNVSKILNELNTTQREDAVNSLAYEADARLRDPVYGCVGLISVLQHRLKQVQKDLHEAKIELASYIGPNVLPVLNQGFIPQIHSMPSSSEPYNMQPAMGIAAPTNVYQQQQEMVTFVNSIEQQEMLRNYEQQQQQQQQPVDIVRHVTGSGFNPMTAPATMSPSLSLGSTYVNDMCHIPQQGQDQKPQLQEGQQFLLQQETTQQPAVLCTPATVAQRTTGEEDRNVAPSC